MFLGIIVKVCFLVFFISVVVIVFFRWGDEECVLICLYVDFELLFICSWIEKSGINECFDVLFWECCFLVLIIVLNYRFRIIWNYSGMMVVVKDVIIF